MRQPLADAGISEGQGQQQEIAAVRLHCRLLPVYLAPASRRSQRRCFRGSRALRGSPGHSGRTRPGKARSIGRKDDFRPHATWCASKVPLEAAAIDPEETAALTPSAVAEMRAQEATAIREEQAHFLRDIMGNPFRPLAVDPSWLTPTVVGFAQAAYDQRIMPSGILDNGRLAILADALEDARCMDDAILGHLRGSGQHFRGCHVLDHVSYRLRPADHVSNRSFLRCGILPVSFAEGSIIARRQIPRTAASPQHVPAPGFFRGKGGGG